MLCPQNLPGKNTGVHCHFLLQGIFPTEGANPRLLRLLHWQTNSSALCHTQGCHISGCLNIMPILEKLLTLRLCHLKISFPLWGNNKVHYSYEGQSKCFMHALVAQLCPTLCDPIDCSLSGFSVHEILQARILEWADISSFRGSSWPRDWTWASYVSCMGRPILCHWTSWEIGPTAMKVLFTQSCPTLCDPMDCSPPDSSVYGILQAGILKWITIPFSKGSSLPRDQTQASCTAGRFFTIWATREYYGHDQISLLTKIWFAL